MTVAQGGSSASHTDIFSPSLHPFFYTPPPSPKPAFGIPFLGAGSQSGRRKGGCAARGLAEALERQPCRPVAAREASPEQGRGGISQGTEKRAALGGGRPETVGLRPRCPFPFPRNPHGSPRPACLAGHPLVRPDPALCLFLSAGRRKTGDADEDSPRRLLRRGGAHRRRRHRHTGEVRRGGREGGGSARGVTRARVCGRRRRGGARGEGGREPERAGPGGVWRARSSVQGRAG